MRAKEIESIRSKLNSRERLGVSQYCQSFYWNLSLMLQYLHLDLSIRIIAHKSPGDLASSQ